MPQVFIIFRSHDGHTAKISRYLAEKITAHGQKTTLWNLADHPHIPPSQLAEADIIVLAAAIRYGKPLPGVTAFLTEHQKRLANSPFALLLVNLTARKPGKTTVEGSVYLRKLIQKYRFKPAVAAAIAGKLDYPRYNWRDRQIIRFIMHLTKGPTDPSTCIEFTDWQQVDNLAKEISALTQASTPQRLSA